MIVREVKPDNTAPVLFCQGKASCGGHPSVHHFRRADPVGGVYRLIFEASCCGHERVFGVLDAAQVARG